MYCFMHVMNHVIWGNGCAYSLIEFFQVLRRYLDDSGLPNVRIVAPDAHCSHGQGWKKICGDITRDPELRAAVNAIGYVSNLVNYYKCT